MNSNILSFAYHITVEMGCLTNTTDAELLSTDPRSFAREIYNGMLMYFQLV